MRSESEEEKIRSASSRRVIQFILELINKHGDETKFTDHDNGYRRFLIRSFKANLPMAVFVANNKAKIREYDPAGRASIYRLLDYVPNVRNLAQEIKPGFEPWGFFLAKYDEAGFKVYGRTIEDAQAVRDRAVGLWEAWVGQPEVGQDNTFYVDEEDLKGKGTPEPGGLAATYPEEPSEVEINCPYCEGSGKVMVVAKGSTNFSAKECLVCHGEGKLVGVEH